MRTSDLPFEIERACRCSFVVRLNNGDHAFISNANLLAFLRDPYTQYEIIPRKDVRRGTETNWIAIHVCSLDFGFKKPVFSDRERF